MLSLKEKPRSFVPLLHADGVAEAMLRSPMESFLVFLRLPQGVIRSHNNLKQTGAKNEHHYPRNAGCSKEDTHNSCPLRQGEVLKTAGQRDENFLTALRQKVREMED